MGFLSSCSLWNKTLQSETLEIKGANYCYFNKPPDSLLNKNSLYDQPIVLQLIDPEFQLSYRTVNPDEVLEFEGDNDKYFFKIKDSHDEFDFNIVSNPSLFKTAYPNDVYLKDSTQAHSKKDNLLFCMKKRPDEYEKFSKKELIALNYKIPFYEIKSNAKILKRYVRKKPKHLRANEIFFSSENELNISSSCINCGMGGGTINQLRIKLIEYGYKLLPNGVIFSGKKTKLTLKDSQTTRAAIKDFQKRNGIEPYDQITYEALKALGIQF